MHGKIRQGGHANKRKCVEFNNLSPPLLQEKNEFELKSGDLSPLGFVKILSIG